MDLETEAAQRLPTDPSKEAWPVRGRVDFDDAVLKYRPDLPAVLKKLSFTIKPGEKVGIVGRTGAGKSSIAQALFRTVELSGGTISVDGVDLRGLGLSTVGRVLCDQLTSSQLRDRISVIPQDAFLFAGTVRYALLVDRF